VVSFTPRAFYPRGKRPPYPLDKRLGGPKNRSGRCGEETNLAPTGTRTPTPRYTAIPTALSRLLLVYNVKLISLFFSQSFYPDGLSNFVYVHFVSNWLYFHLFPNIFIPNTV
jgi:hypothetical protein